MPNPATGEVFVVDQWLLNDHNDETDYNRHLAAVQKTRGGREPGDPAGGGLGFDEKQLQALADGDFEEAHGFAPKRPPAEPEGGEQAYAAVFKVILSCPTEDFHRELIDAPEKNTAGDAAAAKLGRLLKGIDFSCPNVT